MGNVGKIVFSGTAALALSESKTEKSGWDFDISKIVVPVDNKILVREYQKVQRKYYPEKDIFYKGSKICR